MLEHALSRKLQRADVAAQANARRSSSLGRGTQKNGTVAWFCSVVIAAIIIHAAHIVVVVEAIGPSHDESEFRIMNE